MMISLKYPSMVLFSKTSCNVFFQYISIYLHVSPYGLISEDQFQSLSSPFDVLIQVDFASAIPNIAEVTNSLYGGFHPSMGVPQ